MAYKTKLKLGSIQANKFISGVPEKRENIKAQVEFRNDISESQKRINYKNESDCLQGAKRLQGLDTNTKTRMKESQKQAKQSLNGAPPHRICSFFK